MHIDSLESAYSYLCQGGETLSILINFYNLYKQIQEDFSLKLNGISYELECSELVKPLSSAISYSSNFIKQIANQHLEAALNIQTLILEPLSTFRENFNSSTFEVIKSTKESLFKLEEIRAEMHLKRDNYFRASVRAEKAEQVLNIEDERERLELAKQNAEEMKALALKASEQYLNALAEEKQVWGDYEDNRKFCVNSLRESEESRIEFVKKIIEKHLKIESKVSSALLCHGKDLEKHLLEVNSNKEAVEFSNLYLNIAQHSREEWTPYEKWKKEIKVMGNDPLENEETWISSEVPYIPMQSSLALIKTVVYFLIPLRKRLSSELKIEKCCIDYVEDKDFSQLEVLLSNPTTWISFIQAVELRRRTEMIEYQNMEKLSSFFSIILTHMIKSEKFETSLFYKIITVAHDLYCVKDARKLFLLDFLSDHSVFQSKSSWKKTIKAVISARVVSERELFYRNKQTSRLRTLFSDKFPEKVAEQNSTLMYISQFNFYMINFKVPIQMAYSIVCDCSKKAKLDPEKITPLVIELHSLNPEFKLEPNTRHKSLRKSSKSRGKWGSYLFLGLAIEFLPRKDIYELLFVSKAWKSIILPWFYQHELLNYSNLSIRKQVWDYFLYKPQSTRSYQSIVKDLNLNPSTIKGVEDVITMDILRSYSNRSDIDSHKLREVLRAYAFYQSKVGYCQGMNYIAGTLYYLFQSSERTFWAMCTLIRQNSMFDLYSEDLPKLKCLFFTLDRLTALHLPDLHTTFNLESITSSSFSSPWFLTLFAALLSSTFPLQLQIWDLFIFVTLTQKGWKIIFKVAINILARLSPSMLWKKYEEIMCLLTGIQGSPEFKIFDKDFLQESMKVKVTNKMLSQIKREFDKLKIR